MFRCRLVLAMLILGLCATFAAAQPVKGKGKVKDKKDPVPVPVELDTYFDDLKVVRQGGLKGEGADILEYFRKRTLKQPDPKQIAKLITDLGDEDFPTREKAFKELAVIGPAALAGMKDWEGANKVPTSPQGLLAADPLLETRRRIAELKLRIDTKAEPTLQAAAARVLAKLKPEGAADGLIAFLPFASDPMVVDEICKTLGAVAVRNGKVEPVLIKSLEDPIAIKRAAAGDALARAKATDEYPRVKKLFADKDLTVRLRVCLAMLTAQDPELVPVMIDLLGELNPNQLWPIEEALIRLAGDKAPNVGLGSDEKARKACKDAWSKWYQTSAKTIDMAKLTAANAYLGYTLVVQFNNQIGAGALNQSEIYELDKEKRVRWKFNVAGGQNAIVDAQVLNGNRVLLAEYQFARVTERDHKGEIKWSHNCGGNPFAVQRLPNGNTFIAMQGRLLEIDRNKNEVWSYQRPNQDIIRARKLPNGEVAFVTNLGAQGQFHRMDPKTQKINIQFAVTPVQILFGTMDVLPNGHVVIAHFQQNRVNEYDQKGALVGNGIQMNLPSSVVRLPNGNNLIASYNQRRIAEYQGANVVWEYQAPGILFVARRR